MIELADLGFAYSRKDKPLFYGSVLVLAWLWVLFVAYQCLKDHEVQDAL